MLLKKVNQETRNFYPYKKIVFRLLRLFNVLIFYCEYWAFVLQAIDEPPRFIKKQGDFNIL